MPARTLLITDPAMTLHDPGPGHPERPARLQAIQEVMDGLQLEGVSRAKPQAATRSQIERVHDPKYIDEIESLRRRSARLDADTAVSPNSVETAYLAAGAAIDAVEAVTRSAEYRVLGAEVSERSTHHPALCRRVFALVRPPGHHAERDHAMGFCLFNNVAIAAAYAVEELDCQRVLIVDWDVHHGNGTQHIFDHRRDVLYFSSHEWPLYPGTGALNEFGIGEGEGFTVNAPLPAGTDDATMVGLYRRLLVPIADAYQPDVVLVSAGFDAHREDPLAGMRMTEAGFAALCGIMREVAERHANGRLALILEGGYALAALVRSVSACIEVLAGATPPLIDPPGAAATAIIDQICDAHRRYWPMIR